MTIYELETLTNEMVNEHFKENRAMKIKTKSGTVYHIFKVGNGYKAFSEYCKNARPLTKEMKRVFN